VQIAEATRIQADPTITPRLHTTGPGLVELTGLATTLTTDIPNPTDLAPLAIETHWDAVHVDNVWHRAFWIPHWPTAITDPALGSLPGVAFVFLDADGTLLPFGASTVGSSSLAPTAGSPLVGHLDLEVAARLTVLPCELVWATTWMAEANEVLAPLLGRPALPVLDWPEPSVQDRFFGLHPKTRSVLAWAGAVDFAWVDDEITEADREWVDEHRSGAALLLRVDPHLGLTGTDLATLEKWLLGRST